MGDIDHHLVARQMRRQRAEITSGAGGSRFGRMVACGLGSVLGRLMLGDSLLLVLKSELQLIRRQLFGAATELVSREALDQQAQLVVLGIQFAQHLLQQDRVVRQVVGIALHVAMMNEVIASLPEFVAPDREIIRRVPVCGAVPARAIRTRRATRPIVPATTRSVPSWSQTATRTGRARAVWSTCKARHRHARSV